MTQAPCSRATQAGSPASWPDGQEVALLRVSPGKASVSPRRLPLRLGPAAQSPWGGTEGFSGCGFTLPTIHGLMDLETPGIKAQPEPGGVSPSL